MPLFSIKNEQLERVKEVPFRSERKDTQRITEASLEEVFGFISSIQIVFALLRQPGIEKR
jgi:hypothetical protein